MERLEQKQMEHMRTAAAEASARCATIKLIGLLVYLESAKNCPHLTKNS